MLAKGYVIHPWTEAYVRRLLIFLWIVTTVCVVIGWFFLSPHWTLHEMQKAVKTKNDVALSNHIDFASLRENLKGQFSAVMLASINEPDVKNNPFAGLVLLVGKGVIDTMVDMMVTPSGLRTVMQSGTKGVGELAAGRPVAQIAKPIFGDYQISHEGLSGFTATVKADDGEQVRYEFLRHGIDWKLSNIRLPFEKVLAKRRNAKPSDTTAASETGPSSNVGARETGQLQAQIPGLRAGNLRVREPAKVAQSQGWIVKEDKSEMDDSPRVTLLLLAENSHNAWLTKEWATLVIRCRERERNVFVVTGGMVDRNFGDREDGARVRYQKWSRKSEQGYKWKLRV
jgi:hypothetical protein